METAAIVSQTMRRDDHAVFHRNASASTIAPTAYAPKWATLSEIAKAFISSIFFPLIEERMKMPSAQPATVSHDAMRSQRGGLFTSKMWRVRPKATSFAKAKLSSFFLDEPND